MHRINPIILQRARELRQPQTPAEEKLWYWLRDSQLDGLKFRRQHPIGRFIVDFYCAQEKLVIEIDGDSHSSPVQMEYDQARTDWLEEQGCRVMRFNNDNVRDNVGAVVEAIAGKCK